MLPLIRPYKGLYKLPGTPKINWNHPLASNLVGCWVLDGTTPFNLVTGEMAKVIGNVIPLPGPSGIEANFNQAFGNRTNYYQVRQGPILSGQSYFSILSVQRLNTANATSGSQSAAVYCERAPSGNDILKTAFGIGVQAQATYPAFTYRNDGGTLLNNTFGSGLNDNRQHVFHTTKAGSAASGNNIFSYIDGVQVNAENWSTNDTFTNSGIVSSLGGDVVDTGSGFTSGMSMVAIFNKAHSPAEAAAFAFDPFAFLIFPKERIASLLKGTSGSSPVTPLPGLAISSSPVSSAPVSGQTVIDAAQFLASLSLAPAAPTCAITAAETFSGSLALAPAIPVCAITAAETFSGSLALAPSTPTCAITVTSGAFLAGLALTQPGSSVINIKGSHNSLTLWEAPVIDNTRKRAEGPTLQELRQRQPTLQQLRQSQPLLGE